MLVFVSVNHLLPTPAVEEEEDDRAVNDPQQQQEVDENVSENHEVTQEEIIDLPSNIAPEEEQQKCWAEAAPQPEKTTAY